MAFKTLLLPPGIERNATPYDTSGRWWDMNLVRWQAGTLRPLGGWQRATSVPLDSTARGIHMYRDNSNVRHILVGSEVKLYIDTGSTFTDITPNNFVPLEQIGTAAGYGTLEYGFYTYGDARPGTTTLYSSLPFWSFSNWGEDVILTANSDGNLYYYVTTTVTTKPTKITTGPGGVSCVVVTDERHCMAIGASLTGISGAAQRRVAWSSREDYTDWNVASTTNTAGYLDLDARTPLTKAVKVREGVLILSLSEAYLARYVGLPYIYGIERIADTTILSPAAFAEFSGKAMWMGRNGFWFYEGGYIKPIECPIANDIFANMDPIYGPRRAHAIHNGSFPEVWFFYPTVGNSETNRYVIYNYAEGWWSWGQLSRTAGVSGETYPHPFMAGTDGHLYEHELGWTDAGNPRTNIFAETGMLPLTDGSRGITINQVLPNNGDGYDSLKIKFYSRQTPEGTEKVWPSYTPRPNGYTDCRVSGRDIRIRIEATKDIDWSIGSMRFNVEQGTGR